MMKKNVLKFMLLAITLAMFLSITGCNGSAGPGEATEENSIGEGGTSFSVKVTDNEDVTTLWIVYTDEETVGDALYVAGLVEGEHTDFGLMIRSVDGLVADFDANGAWWGFFINEELAAVGVSDTIIESDEEYALVYMAD